MVRRQLARILDDNDALVLRHRGEQGGKQGRLADLLHRPLIRNASSASIMRVNSWAAPRLNEPEAMQSWSQKLRLAGTRSEIQVPGDAKQTEHGMHADSVRKPGVHNGTASSKPAI